MRATTSPGPGHSARSGWARRAGRVLTKSPVAGDDVAVAGVRPLFGVLVAALLIAAVMVPNPGLHGALGFGPATQPDRATMVARGGTYRFMQHQRGAPNEPVAYDPCKVIWIRINTDGVPDRRQALDVVLHAIREVSAATGLRLRYAGPSSDLPHWPPASQSVRTDLKPVLVAFATSDEVPRLEGRVTGIGGSTSVRRDGFSTYVSGQVTLDSHTFARLLSQPAFLDEARAITMHEFGHLVGLAHVQDARELMYAKNTGQVGFGPGDRLGLARLGQGRCR